MNRTALVHLTSGIGNIVFATPLLVALERLGLAVDVLVEADYTETADLFRDWSTVSRLWTAPPPGPVLAEYTMRIPAIPPFYWNRFKRQYSASLPRPPDDLFYTDEQEYYLWFARRLGFPSDEHPYYRLPISPSNRHEVGERTVVLAPGSKTGEMALKRWPYFTELAEAFEDVAVIGTPDDLRDPGGRPIVFPPHVRSFAGRLKLRETAELIAAAGALVGNDSGLSHIAGAAGTPAVILFGPTPHSTLGVFPPNVRVVRSGFACEPCWFRDRFRACDRRIDCLHEVMPSRIVQEIRCLSSLKPCADYGRVGTQTRITVRYGHDAGSRSQIQSN